MQEKKSRSEIAWAKFLRPDNWGKIQPPPRQKSGLTKKERDARRYAENKDDINAARREKRRCEAIEREMAEEYHPSFWPPPCGGDCENCPYDDGCRFADWEDQERERRRTAKQKAKNKRSNDRKAQRRRDDPVYRQDINQKAVRRSWRKKWLAAGLPAEAFDAAYESGEYLHLVGRKAKRKMTPEQKRVVAKLNTRKYRAKEKFLAAGGTLEEFQTALANGEIDTEPKPKYTPEEAQQAKRVSQAKHRAKKKFLASGGTAEEFERKWRRDHE